MSTPPLPAGYALDKETSGTPPLPSGYALDAQKYAPGRGFGMQVAKGMGLDADAVAKAEDEGGHGAAAMEIGKQILSGVGGFAKKVAMDPFHVMDPIHAMASNVTQAAGLPNTGNVLDAKNYHAPNAGQLLGATAAVLGGAETAEKAPAAVAATGDVVRGGWRKIGNPMGLASTGQELLKQGISPRTSMAGFDVSLERAAGDLKAYDAESPIKNVHDLNDAIPEIKQKIWSEEVEPALKRQAAKPVDMKPVAEAVRGQVSDEMREFDEANANKLDTLADKLENARDVTSANKLLKYVNGQLESYFQKFPAARRANLMNNPETAGWEAARSELRNQFLTTMEQAGETGVRDARLRYGAFDTLQDAVERRVNVADRAKPMSLGRIVGLAGAVPTGGLSVLAGELSNYLNKPDVLIRRGIKKLPED